MVKIKHKYKYQCIECNREFWSFQDLVKHFKESNHKQELKLIDSTDKEYRKNWLNNKSDVYKKEKWLRQKESPNYLISKRNYYEKNKERIREYKREYRKRNLEKIKIKSKEYLNDPIIKVQRKEYRKEYFIENKDKINLYYRNSRKINESVRIKSSLHSLFWSAFKRYSKNGKVNTSKKYGIDWEAIIIHLGKKPDNDYDVDHIIPLCKFDFDNPEEVKKAFAPENHRWLKSSINRSIGGGLWVEN